MPVKTKDLTINWKNCGIRSGIPEYPASVNVKDFGAAGNGTTDDSKAFILAIEAAKEQTAIFIPTGNYLIRSPLNIAKGLSLRGESRETVRLTFDFPGAPKDNAILFCPVGRENPWIKVIGPCHKGSTRLKLMEPFLPSEFIEICQDNDPVLMYTKEIWNQDWAQMAVGQVIPVKKLAKDLLTLQEPLHISFDSRQDIKVRRLEPIIGAGLENLTLERKDPGDGCMVVMRRCAYGFVRNIESSYTMRAHVSLETSLGCEVRDSFFHHAHDYGGGGHGYGVECKEKTSICLIENNDFDTLRHAMIVHVGANGNVYGYNHSTNPLATGDHDPSTAVCDISIHGHYPFMNLFEGNSVQKIEISDYWGPSGPGNTFLRNIVSLEGIQINDLSPGQVFLGNTISHPDYGFDFTGDTKPETTIFRGNTVKGIKERGRVPKSLYKKN